MKEEAKMVYLLECLQKTPPPVSMLGTMWSRWGMGGAGRGDPLCRVGMWLSHAPSMSRSWDQQCCVLCSARENGLPQGAVLVPAVPACRKGSYTMPVLPQVLIFAEKKADVDAIHEYLLLKGVEAVAIHGGKGQ